MVTELIFGVDFGSVSIEFSKAFMFCRGFLQIHRFMFYPSSSSLIDFLCCDIQELKSNYYYGSVYSAEQKERCVCLLHQQTNSDKRLDTVRSEKV